jgi:hypothetical protein
MPLKVLSRFRLLGKKRGERRTGSPLAGSVGEAAFFGVLFLLGTIALTALVTSQILNPTPELYQFGFGFWLVVLVLTSFVLIGGIGVLLTVAEAGASAERRSALVRRATGMQLLSEALPSPQDYPNVPRDAGLADSPGVHLAYRLPMDRRNAWTLATIAGLSLLVSGFAAVLSVIFVQTCLAGRPDWLALTLALPFLAAAGWSIYHFLHSIWHQNRVGPTLLEISDLPLRPGKQYDIFLSQSGRSPLQWLSVQLVCDEETTYHQGTDIRTETRVVSTTEIVRRQEIRLEPGQPWELTEALAIPSQAMHSFQSAHNAIRWRLVVRGKPVQGAAFERHFPLIIYPHAHQPLTPAARGIDRFQVDHGTAD